MAEHRKIQVGQEQLMLTGKRGSQSLRTCYYLLEEVCSSQVMGSHKADKEINGNTLYKKKLKHRKLMFDGDMLILTGEESSKWFECLHETLQDCIKMKQQVVRENKKPPLRKAVSLDVTEFKLHKDLTLDKPLESTTASTHSKGFGTLNPCISSDPKPVHKSPSFSSYEEHKKATNDPSHANKSLFRKAIEDLQAQKKERVHGNDALPLYARLSRSSEAYDAVPSSSIPVPASQQLPACAQVAESDQEKPLENNKATTKLTEIQETVAQNSSKENPMQKSSIEKAEAVPCISISHEQIAAVQDAESATSTCKHDMDSQIAVQTKPISQAMAEEYTNPKSIVTADKMEEQSKKPISSITDEKVIVYMREQLLHLSNSKLSHAHPVEITDSSCEVLLCEKDVVKYFIPIDHKKPTYELYTNPSSVSSLAPFQSRYSLSRDSHYSSISYRRHTTSATDPRSWGDAVSMKGQERYRQEGTTSTQNNEGFNVQAKVEEVICDDVFHNEAEYTPSPQVFTNRPRESQDAAYVQDLLDYYESHSINPNQE